MRSDLPTQVKVDVRTGLVSWINPKHNPWKDLHHQAERDYTGGEYTRRKAQAAVEREFRNTDSSGYLCPNQNCTEGYCHYRATTNSSWCPNCRTGMTAGSHEVFSTPNGFRATQWYLLQVARWSIVEARRQNIPLSLTLENDLVDAIDEHQLYSVKKVLAYFQQV